MTIGEALARAAMRLGEAGIERPQAEARILLEAASGREALGFRSGDKYPPTDHLAFLRAGWPAVSFSLVGAGEIDDILLAFSGKQPAQAPKVMQVIHSASDDTTQLDAGNVPAALRVLEAGLRAWDARTRAAARAP